MAPPWRKSVRMSENSIDTAEIFEKLKAPLMAASLC